LRATSLLRGTFRVFGRPRSALLHESALLAKGKRKRKEKEKERKKRKRRKKKEKKGNFFESALLAAETPVELQGVLS